MPWCGKDMGRARLVHGGAEPRGLAQLGSGTPVVALLLKDHAALQVDLRLLPRPDSTRRGGREIGGRGCTLVKALQLVF